MSKMFCCLQVKPLGFLKPSSLMKVSSRFKAHQDSLPRLPVPALQQSLDRYLKALQPIVSEEEWAQTKQLVEEFQTSGGCRGAAAEGAGAQGQEDGELGEWSSLFPHRLGGPESLTEAQVVRGPLAVACCWPHAEFSNTSCSGTLICAMEFLECLLCAQH